MSKKLLWIIALVCALVFNSVVFADSSVCRPGLAKLVQMINLTDEQKAKIKPVLEQLKSTLQSARSQMGDIRTQLTQQVESSSMDQEKVNSLVDQKTKLIGEMIKAKIMAKNQIFSVLNPQQKERLQSMMQRIEEKMKAKFKACKQDE